MYCLLPLSSKGEQLCDVLSPLDPTGVNHLPLHAAVNARAPLPNPQTDGITSHLLLWHTLWTVTGQMVRENVNRGNLNLRKRNSRTEFRSWV